MSGTVCSRMWLTRPSTSGKSSTVVPFACPSTPCCKKYRPLNLGDAENARPENDGQRKLWVWKMQEWKMTDKYYRVWKMQDWKMADKLLANCEHNYGVWKMQEYKSTWVQPTHRVYIKEAVRDTLQSTTGMSSHRYAKWLSAVSYTYWHGYACVFLMCIWRTIVRHFSN